MSTPGRVELPPLRHTRGVHGCLVVVISLLLGVVLRPWLFADNTASSLAGFVVPRSRANQPASWRACLLRLPSFFEVSSPTSWWRDRRVKGAGTTETATGGHANGMAVQEKSHECGFKEYTTNIDALRWRVIDAAVAAGRPAFAVMFVGDSTARRQFVHAHNLLNPDPHQRLTTKTIMKAPPNETHSLNLLEWARRRHRPAATTTEAETSQEGTGLGSPRVLPEWLRAINITYVRLRYLYSTNYVLTHQVASVRCSGQEQCGSVDDVAMPREQSLPYSPRSTAGVLFLTVGNWDIPRPGGPRDELAYYRKAKQYWSQHVPDAVKGVQALLDSFNRPRSGGKEFFLAHGNDKETGTTMVGDGPRMTAPSTDRTTSQDKQRRGTGCSQPLVVVNKELMLVNCSSQRYPGWRREYCTKTFNRRLIPEMKWALRVPLAGIGVPTVGLDVLTPYCPLLDGIHFPNATAISSASMASIDSNRGTVTGGELPMLNCYTLELDVLWNALEVYRERTEHSCMDDFPEAEPAGYITSPATDILDPEPTADSWHSMRKRTY